MKLVKPKKGTTMEIIGTYPKPYQGLGFTVYETKSPPPDLALKVVLRVVRMMSSMFHWNPEGLLTPG